MITHAKRIDWVRTKECNLSCTLCANFDRFGQVMKEIHNAWFG